jgi:CRP-like cAMP-binding protein
MFAIGAEARAPQYGSILLLAFFYLTDFEFVRFIPKACFSSLLVLGAVDTFFVWFFLSFRKTQDICEWLVNPFIVALSLVVGFLNAVFLGVGISMFVFVASFFRVGVVKYNATGLELHSTIERPNKQAEYLDSNGDQIQILVLQNYLFFGNASSILHYISTMFEDVEEGGGSFDLPPIPKVLIMDLSLITGMDTSTVDIFADIKELCQTYDCKLYMCGLSPRVRAGLALGGVKPKRGGLHSKHMVRFFPDLDTALGKAEDLLTMNLKEDATPGNSRYCSAQSQSPREDGFRYAMKLLDHEHGIEFAKDLLELEPFTVPVDLLPGDYLYKCDGGTVQDCERGLFFIESGLLKIERDVSASLTRSRTRGGRHDLTLSMVHARRGSIGRKGAVKASTLGLAKQTKQGFRLARIGPGWVVGMVECVSGLRNPGAHVAVSRCRLHHLPKHKLEEIEKENPELVLKLYKLLAHLMAHHQEVAIEQLESLKTIFSSPAHRKPLSRAALRAIS